MPQLPVVCRSISFLKKMSIFRRVESNIAGTSKPLGNAKRTCTAIVMYFLYSLSNFYSTKQAKTNLLVKLREIKFAASLVAKTKKVEFN
jgi:hypothetical protein